MSALRSFMRPMVHRIRKAKQMRTLRKEFAEFKRLNDLAGNRFHIRWEDRWPQLDDRTATTGFDPHYTYHPAWAARLLAKEKPAKHVDISSTLNFVGIASAFIPIDFYDYRPANLRLSNLKTGSADLTHLFFENNSISSLSCMHTIEHIGLGRYGDPLDAAGDIRAAKELKRVLAPGGLFLFVTPVGQSRVCYNAHRVYAYEQAIELFEGLELEHFTLVPDDHNEGMVEWAKPSQVNAQKYGCGCFAFRKPIAEAQ